MCVFAIGTVLFMDSWLYIRIYVKLSNNNYVIYKTRLDHRQRVF